MARLSSPQSYYMLSGSDFTLDINNLEESKIFCMANNPQKIEIYEAVLLLHDPALKHLVVKKKR